MLGQSWTKLAGSLWLLMDVAGSRWQLLAAASCFAVKN